MSYQKKYLIYKHKYLKLKQIGGTIDLGKKMLEDLSSYEHNEQILYHSIMEKDGLFYILVGEDHYKLNAEQSQNIFSNIVAFLKSTDAKLFLEADDKSLDFSMVESSVEPPVESPAKPAAESPAKPAAESPVEPPAKPAAESPVEPPAKPPILYLRGLNLPGTINYDIRTTINPLYNNNVRNIIFMLEYAIQHFIDVYVNSNYNDDILFQIIDKICNFIDNNFTRYSYLYLLKSEDIYSKNFIIKKLYEEILKKIKLSINKLIESIKILFKKVKSSDTYNIYEELLEEIIFMNDQQITDLYLLTKILENNSNINLIYGGIAHIKNIESLLRIIGFTKI